MCVADDMYRLLLEREKTFQDKTQEVFAGSEFLCQAIQEHLKVNARDTKWLSIDMIGQDIVVMVSIPDLTSDDYAAPGHEPVKVLTVVIPCSVVDIGDPEVILNFLEETFDIRQFDGEEVDEDIHGIVAAAASTRGILH